MKRWLFYASLILLAGLVFYLVVPKWHTIKNSDGSIARINRITGEYKQGEQPYVSPFIDGKD